MMIVDCVVWAYMLVIFIDNYVSVYNICTCILVLGLIVSSVEKVPGCYYLCLKFCYILCHDIVLELLLVIYSHLL